MTPGIRHLAALALFGLGLVGCAEPDPVVNERFVPTTSGIVSSVLPVSIDGEEGVRFELIGSGVVEVVAADLDPFKDIPAEGYLLLTGTNGSPWIIGAGRAILDTPSCNQLSGRAFDRGTTIEIEMDHEKGLFLVVQKAPDYKDHGTKANGEVLQLSNCLDDQGRALGPDFQFPDPSR